MVFHVFMGLSYARYQIAFHVSELVIGFFLHLPDGIMALNGNPRQVPVFLPELPAQRVVKDSRFIINCVQISWMRLPPDKFIDNMELGSISYFYCLTFPKSVKLSMEKPLSL